ncbi:MAG: glycoside hydrolase family 16 protein [Gemmatimonadota bacterium]
MTRASLPADRPLFRLGATALVILAGAGCYGDLTSPPNVSWKLAWADEFDGTAGQAPDPANWKFDVGTNWGNNQLEFDTDSARNATLDGAGNLAIVARQQSYQGSSYTSARLTTQGKHEQTLGRFEARIKMPTATGIWPAFWMLGGNCATSPWPKCGEIDIMENFGRNPSRNQGSLHGPGYSGANALNRAFDLPNGELLSDDFHVYRVDWLSDRIVWYVDVQIYQVIKKSYINPDDWVFDHTFYVIMNLAVGGGPPGPPNGTSFPQTMLVDYVRVYSAN